MASSVESKYPASQYPVTSYERMNIRDAKINPEVHTAKDRFLHTSELIAYLTRQLKTHGDLPVFIGSENIGFVITVESNRMTTSVEAPKGRTMPKESELNVLDLGFGTNWNYIV